MNCTCSMSQMGGRSVLSIIYEFKLGMIGLLAYVWDWFYIYMNSRWTYYIFVCIGIFYFYYYFIFHLVIVSLFSASFASVSCLGIKICGATETRCHMNCLPSWDLREPCPSRKVAGLPCSLPAKVTHLLFVYGIYWIRREYSQLLSMAHVALKWTQSFVPLDNNPLDAGLCTNLVEAKIRSRLEPITKEEQLSIELVLTNALKTTQCT